MMSSFDTSQSVSPSSSNAVRKKKNIGKISKRHLRRLNRTEFIHTKLKIMNEISKQNINRNCEVISSKLFTTDKIMCTSNSQIIAENDITPKSNTNISCPNTNRENCEITSNLNTSKMNLVQKLSMWGAKYRPSRNMFNDLLDILISEGHKLSTDSRTLLRTNTIYNFTSVKPGYYCHLGLKQGIIFIFDRCELKLTQNTVINLQVNVDGLPLTRSSQSQFWPILVSINSSNPNIRQPFIVGLYHGSKKPENSDVFLEQFVKEYKILSEEGFLYNNILVIVKIESLICDAPAKSFILAIKSHNAYFGCTKCIQEGEYMKGRVTYPETDAILRTDKSFNLRMQPEFHKSSTILQSINLGLVSQVPLDYMHLVCLGVVKRLINFWVKGRKDHKIPDVNIKYVDKLLVKFRCYIPQEFARKPRALSEFEYWKATEFRQFLLYTGPLVLRSNLSKKKYIHFMSLHTAIKIMCSEKLYKSHLQYAYKLLQYFIRQYKHIYGPEFISHNVHNLIHLPNDVLKYGTLDKFSGFPFENFLFKLKKQVRTSREPLQQALNRIKEERKYYYPIKCYPILHPYLKGPLNNLDFNDNGAKYFKSIVFEYFELNINRRNNCCILKNGDIFLLKSICELNNIIQICGQKFMNKKPFFDSPCSSEILDTYIVSNLNESTYNISPEDISTLLVKISVTENRSDCVYVTNTYCVVKFNGKEDEENSFSAVPVAWLKSNEKECFLPNRNERQCIRKMKNPTEDWKLYPIEVIKKYATYEEALAKEKRIEAKDSFLSVTEEVDNSSKKRKRTEISQIANNDSDSTDTVSEEEDKRLKARMPNKAKYFKVNKNKLKSKTWGKLVKKFLDPNDDQCYLSHFSDSEASSVSPPPVIEPTMSNTQTEIATAAMPDLNAVEIDANLVNIDESIFNTTPVLLDNMQINDSPTLTLILEQVISIKNTVNRLEAFITSNESNIKPLNFELLPDLPTKNVEEVKLLEQKINGDRQCNLQFIRYLEIIGGTNIKNAVFRTIPKVFTNEVGTKYSWTGQKNNNPLKDLTIMESIKISIKKNFPAVRDAEFEEHVKSWFRHAAQRLARVK